jgi:hypothetical protein
MPACLWRDAQHQSDSGVPLRVYEDTHIPEFCRPQKVNPRKYSWSVFSKQIHEAAQGASSVAVAPRPALQCLNDRAQKQL